MQRGRPLATLAALILGALLVQPAQPASATGAMATLRALAAEIAETSRLPEALVRRRIVTRYNSRWKSPTWRRAAQWRDLLRFSRTRRASILEAARTDREFYGSLGLRVRTGQRGFHLSRARFLGESNEGFRLFGPGCATIRNPLARSRLDRLGRLAIQEGATTPRQWARALDRSLARIFPGMSRKRRSRRLCGLIRGCGLLKSVAGVASFFCGVGR